MTWPTECPKCGNQIPGSATLRFCRGCRMIVENGGVLAIDKRAEDNEHLHVICGHCGYDGNWIPCKDAGEEPGK